MLSLVCYVFLPAALWAGTISGWSVDWAIPRESVSGDTVAVKVRGPDGFSDSLRAALIAAGVDSADIVSLDEARARVRGANWTEDGGAKQ